MTTQYPNYMADQSNGYMEKTYTPEEIPIEKDNTDIARMVTNTREAIESLRQYLLAVKRDEHGNYMKDPNRQQIINQEGADAICSWLEALSSPNMPLSRHEENEIAIR